MSKSPLSRYLKARRKAAGLTLLEVSRVAGVSAPTCHRYEAGQRVPPVEMVDALAEAYRVEAFVLRPMVDAAWGRR